MLKDPLVNVYADIISFGLGAVKLLNKSRIREQCPFPYTRSESSPVRHVPVLSQQLIARGT
jgi:hypothetical protein